MLLCDARERHAAIEDVVLGALPAASSGREVPAAQGPAASSPSRGSSCSTSSLMSGLSSFRSGGPSPCRAWASLLVRFLAPHRANEILYEPHTTGGDHHT
jgi:hypothetical protein